MGYYKKVSRATVWKKRTEPTVQSTNVTEGAAVGIQLCSWLQSAMKDKHTNTDRYSEKNCIFLRGTEEQSLLEWECSVNCPWLNTAHKETDKCTRIDTPHHKVTWGNQDEKEWKCREEIIKKKKNISKTSSPFTQIKNRKKAEEEEETKPESPHW